MKCETVLVPLRSSMLKAVQPASPAHAVAAAVLHAQGLAPAQPFAAAVFSSSFGLPAVLP
eukprot:SAG22_NODE_21829_length_253_cov_1.422078_1_plen_59_part_01